MFNLVCQFPSIECAPAWECFPAKDAKRKLSWDRLVMSALDREVGISEWKSALGDKVKSLAIRTVHRHSHWKARARDGNPFSDGLA